MSNEIITYKTFSIPGIENRISQLQEELTDFVQTQGRQDGQKEEEIYEALYKIQVKDHIQSKGQEHIDFVIQNVLVASQVIHTRDIEQSANHACVQKQQLINEHEHQIQALKRKLKSCTPEHFKTKLAKWLMPVAIFIGLADAVMAYIGFRSASYPTLLALISSAAIAVVIIISHLLYATWIMQTPEKKKKLIKTTIVLLVASAFFYWISVIRANGINAANSLHEQIIAGTVTLDSAPYISIWAICAISVVMFAVVLFFSLMVWRSKEERIQEQQYRKIQTEIINLGALNNKLKEEILKSQSDLIQKKHEARVMYDYVRKTIQRIKHICEASIALYKQTYARFSTSLPSFFMYSDPLEFDENIQLSQPEKQSI